MSNNNFCVFGFLYVVFLLFISSNCYAQKETFNWYFGNHAGITFLTDDNEPIFLPGSKMEQMEGVATISDRHGNLLFYSDGVCVWNKKHNYISYGGGLKGDYSSSRSVIIVPKPRSNRYYYVFTIDAFERSLGVNADTNGLRYSIIDVLAEDGGAILRDQRNIQLLNGAVEKLITINHANQSDIWLVTYCRLDNSFYTYLVNRNGINKPIITKLNNGADAVSLENTVFNLEYDIKHHKLINCSRYNYSFEIYDFDNSTGKIDIKNAITLPSYNYSESEQSIDSTKFFIPYSAAFSEDGTKFYGSCYRKSILQYDLTLNSIDEIRASRTVIADSALGDGSFGSIRRGPNNKIYVTCDTSEYLAVINYPNKDKLECNFVKHAIYLEGGQCRLGLPIMMDYNVPPCEFSGYAGEDKDICYGESVTLGDVVDTTNLQFEWTPSKYLDNPYILNPICKPLKTTQYILKITNVELDCFDFDTITVTVNDLPVVQKTQDIFICKNSPIVIGNDENSDEYDYSWYPHDYLEDPFVKTPTCTPLTDMTYVVTITNKSGCKSYDTVNVYLKALENVRITGGKYICENDSLVLTLKGVFSYCKWITGDTTASIVVREPGIYSVEVIDQNGCYGDLEVEVKLYDNNAVKIIAPDNICEGMQSIIYVEENEEYSEYLWSTGETNSSIEISTSGQYWVKVINVNGCTVYDTVYVAAKELNYSLSDTIINEKFCLQQTSSTKTITLLNQGDELIHIDEWYFKNGIPFEGLLYSNDVTDSTKLDIYIKNDNLEYVIQDTIIIKLSKPCSTEIKIPVNIYFISEEISIASTDIEVNAGEYIKIPIYIDYKLTGEKDNNSNNVFRYEFYCDNSILSIKNVENVIDWNVDGSLLFFTADLKEKDTVYIEALIHPRCITQMDSSILNNINYTELVLQRAEPEYIEGTCYIITSSKAKITFKACMEQALLFRDNTLTMNTSVDKNILNCSITAVSKNNFNIELYDISGHLIDNVNWIKYEDIKEEKIFSFDLINYVNGVYFVVLKSKENNYISNKIIYIKE